MSGDMADRLTVAGLEELMSMALTAARTVSGAVAIPARLAYPEWYGMPRSFPRPLGSVALPLEGDHDEAEWDFAPVVGWARDCDGGWS